VRKALTGWAPLTAAAILVHFFVTKAVAVPVMYGAISVCLIGAFDYDARRRLGRAAGITGRGRYDNLKIQAIELAVDGLKVPPETEREYLRAKLVSTTLFLGTFAAAVAMVFF
jgi:hypothetical protein